MNADEKTEQENIDQCADYQRLKEEILTAAKNGKTLRNGFKLNEEVKVCSHNNLYLFYYANIPSSERLRETLQECQKHSCHKLALAVYLVKLAQGITKYQLLLKRLLGFSSRQTIWDTPLISKWNVSAYELYCVLAVATSIH
uniref:Uncharacterized protein n=1 Tax=Glossina pallidipes TaxID=7398 RepID=A0A1A9ZTF9_GLOPL